MELKKIPLSELKRLVSKKNLLEFNRSIQPRHVAKMSRSVMSCGLLRLPVIGDVSAFDDRGTAIIDGQHLISAITKLPKKHSVQEIDVIFKVYPTKKSVISDIAILNNTQKTWNDTDYLDAWLKYGKDNVSHYMNYYELNNLFRNTFKGLPIGVVVELFAESKKGFREGELVFRDWNFSFKVAQIAHILKSKHKKPAHTLSGLVKWSRQRHAAKKETDFVKLESRLSDAIRSGKDKNCNGRDDFYNFVEDTYTRL